MIALDGIGRLEILHALFGGVLIPPAVAREVFAKTAPPSWLHVTAPATPSSQLVSPTLGPGEREAIALAAAGEE